jgi:hypothetical protein
MGKSCRRRRRRRIRFRRIAFVIRFALWQRIVEPKCRRRIRGIYTWRKKAPSYEIEESFLSSSFVRSCSQSQCVVVAQLANTPAAVGLSELELERRATGTFARCSTLHLRFDSQQHSISGSTESRATRQSEHLRIAGTVSFVPIMFVLVRSTQYANGNGIDPPCAHTHTHTHRIDASRGAPSAEGRRFERAATALHRKRPAWRSCPFVRSFVLLQ